MTDNPAGMAWQTYHDQARKMLDGAQDETSALVGVGWAVLALVEVLKPQDEVVLEVHSDRYGEHTFPPGVPSAYCGDTVNHDAHYWAVAEEVAVQGAMLTARPTSLRWCRGHA